MFNKRTNARLTCLEIFEGAYRLRMDDLEKSIKQIVCEHKTIIFKEKYHPGIDDFFTHLDERTERWKECTCCGKWLQTYNTNVAWLEARLKAEKKAAGKGKKKTTKKAKKKVAP